MTTQQDMQKALGIAEMSESERDSFLEKLGTMAIESALLRFVVTLSAEERTLFNIWLEEQNELEELLVSAEEKYPELAAILDEEVSAMHENISAMV